VIPLKFHKISGTTKLESLGYYWPCLYDPKFSCFGKLRHVTDRQMDTHRATAHTTLA